MLQVTILVLSSLLLAGAYGIKGGTYFIAAPTRLLRGSNYDIAVSILNGTNVNINASLLEYVYNYDKRNYDVTLKKSVTGVFDNGTTGSLSFSIENDLACSSCRLNIRGSGGLQFEQTLYTYIQYNVIAVMVQTEKAIYKPGQTVRFRAFGVYPNLQLYKGSFNVEFSDPRNNKIKILENLSSPNNVVEGNLDLSDQTIFGDWYIRVSTATNDGSTVQTFTVEDYELPRFEVTVELKPYGLTSDSFLTGTVKAKYTFGQPVKGTVELHVGRNSGPDYCGRLPVTTQMGFEIDGEKTFEMSISEVRRSVSVYSGSEVKVLAYVTETTTGVRLNGSSVIRYYATDFSISFLQNTPSAFKPGVPYQAFLQVTDPDNKPPVGGDRVVKVYTYASYSFRLPDQSLYNTYQFTGTFPLAGVEYTLPENGILVFEVDIPKNATSISMKATFRGTVTSKGASRVSSPSDNFIQLSLQGKFIQANTNVGVKIDSTEPLYNVSYGVLSRGAVVESETTNCNGADPCIFELAVTSAMAPTAHLIVYYVRGPNEIVADALAFNVEGIFENEVQISFSRNESEPHENITIDIQADHLSDVQILAVDQSVLLLRSDNDITPDKVSDAVSAFDYGARPTSSEFPLSYSSTSVQSLFSSTGLSILTDLSFLSPGNYYPGGPSYPRSPSYYGAPSTPGSPSYPGSPSQPSSPGSPAMPGQPSSPGQPLKEVDRIRKYFPEGWLWLTKTITEADGKASISATVPDTITSWVASAFATNPVSGLGVAPTTARLRVFRSFFISLKYPDRVVRGEQAVVQATIFNYLPDDADVTVTLKKSKGFRSVLITVNDFNEKSESYVKGDQVTVIRVKSDKQGVVYFPIQLTTIGVVNIEITAQTYVAADGVRRQIVVRPEGAPVTFNYPFFIELDANSTNTEYNDNIDLVLPPSAVKDSESVIAKVTGDLIGSSLRNIEYLLSLPTGCGEQSMVKTAPNLYIGQYLRATGQLSGSLSERIITNLNYGYQRQLWYQRYDGGFSAFGNTDESGSTWLTAFVVRIFTEVLDFTYVDKNMLIRGVDWLVSRQNNDGSFNEFGRVLDRQIQGTGTGPALTAHILLTLLKSDPLAPRQECVQSRINCYQVYRWGNATSNAVKNLENLVTANAISDTFAMSVVSYALTLAGSSKASILFDRLGEYAKSEGSYLYWTNRSPLTQGASSTYYDWRPPRVQYRSIDIITTSYALLTLSAQGRIDEGLPVVRWLTTQKNAYGGFSSTQDTIVALHALSSYATRAYGRDIDLKIKVKGGGSRLKFNVDKENALSLQIKEVAYGNDSISYEDLDNTTFSQETEEKKNGSTDLEIIATGTGVAVVEIEHNFYVTDELSTPSFDVTPVILDADFNSFNLMVCSKWLWNRETGMVVQEIGIPSGFTPDLTSLGGVAGLKRAERQTDIVAVYFDEMSKASICYSILMTREDKVARSQSSYIKTYDYYEPSDQATTPYQPRPLRDATICDVCEGCCPDQQSSSPETPSPPVSPSPPETPSPPVSPSPPQTPAPPQQPPSSPATPLSPESPDAPEYPSTPGSPNTIGIARPPGTPPNPPAPPPSPETPDTPASPDAPVYPSTPSSPSFPEYPSTPESPSSPGNPSTP